MSVIVLCEDEPTIQRLVRASLATTGHQIHVAADGEEGLALIIALRPALVLTDLAMPKLGGIELAERIRARPELAGTPIIFISASLSRVRSLATSSARPEEVLKKPFSPSELRAVVGRYLDLVAPVTVAR